jgi:magnesium-transporting ATPase (P-type)
VFFGDQRGKRHGQAVVVETGPRTYLGGIASSMSTQQIETSFDKGIKKFTYLMLIFMAIMVPAVFFINALSKSPSDVNPDDITNLPSFAGKLAAKADPVSAYLSEQLDTNAEGSPGHMATFAHQRRGAERGAGFRFGGSRFRPEPSMTRNDFQGIPTLEPETSHASRTRRATITGSTGCCWRTPTPEELKKSPKHDWIGAFLFALAVAVGLTPEMLPMIVSVCLSKGALAMAKKKVIVKRLNSIQNFGAMDVLCTDKTGTLTRDHVILEIHCDVFKAESDPVLLDAYLISHFQTGLKNVLDRAVLSHPARKTEVVH